MDLSLFANLPYIGWVAANWDLVLAVLTGAVTLASAVAAITPTPRDDAWAGKAYKVVDWLALNVGKAKQLPGEGS